MITLHWHNTMKGYCDPPTSAYCQRLQKYLRINLDWVALQIEQYAALDPYWHQVSLFLAQINGLQDGFDGKPPVSNPSYRIKDVFSLAMLFQADGDLEDLESALKKDNISRPLKPGSCSALVKLLPDHSDLYVAQDTWTTFQSQLRILKKYDFQFHLLPAKGESVVSGSMMTFSSYPGTLTSGDDYYLINSGLVSMETTIGNGNDALWKYVTPTNAVLEGIRSMVANRLAGSAADWVDVFSRYNSGTYNNEWMVVDYKRFMPGSPGQQGLLYVLEQIPGLIRFADVTDILLSRTYWPSYNVAYFPEIFNQSGGPEMVKKYGDWFTYDKTARANVFRRDHVKVHDLNSMTKLMRYNNFKEDPLSSCDCSPPYSGENAISARSDLNPSNGTYPFASLGHRQHGGIDMKLTSYSMFKSAQFISVAGPTNDQQPPFQWSKSDFEKTVPHLGHPDLFLFKPITHKWEKKPSLIA